jgi:plastocyanin
MTKPRFGALHDLTCWWAARRGATLGDMHPMSVATAAGVFASASSKVPFYLAGGALAGWAVLLGAFGITHPDFPGSEVRSRLVMLTSAVLVAATITTAVTTAGEEGTTEGAAAQTGSAAPTSALNLSADPSGRLAYDKKQATVRSGRFPIRLVNNSSLPHNVTIAKDARVLAHTKTITGGSATTTANLAPGDYVFYCSVDAHRAGGMQGTLTVK